MFVLCVEAVLGARGDGGRSGGRRRARQVGRADLVAVAAGVAAAVLVTGKLNVGVFSGAMLLVTALAVGRPWWRGLILFAAAGAISLVAIWLVTGQSLTNLPAFAAGSIEIIRGYSEAMVVDTHPTVRWVYAAFAILLGLLVWVAWLALRERPRRDLVVVAVLGAILAFAEWKTAFTRNFTFYAMITLLVAAYPFVTRLRMPEGRTIAAFSFASLFIVSLATTRIDPIDLVDVRGSVRSAAQTALAILPWRLDDVGPADARRAARGARDPGRAARPPGRPDRPHRPVADDRRVRLPGVALGAAADLPGVLGLHDGARRGERRPVARERPARPDPARARRRRRRDAARRRPPLRLVRAARHDARDALPVRGARGGRPLAGPWPGRDPVRPAGVARDA